MILTEDLRTARATYERQLCQELKEFAARSVQPPSAAQTLDLWAHLRSIRDEGTQAWVLVHKILDMGWRPMGSVPADFPRTPDSERPSTDELLGALPAVDPDDYDSDLFGGDAA